METAVKIKARIFRFGNKTAEGTKDMKELLGGKGANLAEMSRIGIPVPPGFTITTEVCTEYHKKGRKELIEILRSEFEDGVRHIEKIIGSTYGDKDNPLLLSVRSGARKSMPGMMDTVLNLGLNEDIVEGLIKKTGNERFVWDSYRRFIQMYGSVVLGMKPENKEDNDGFEQIIEEIKEKRNIDLDTEFIVEDLKALVRDFKALVKRVQEKTFQTIHGNNYGIQPWPFLTAGTGRGLCIIEICMAILQIGVRR